MTYTIPCGKTTGHGDSCTTGWLCAACTEIQLLRDKITAASPTVPNSEQEGFEAWAISKKFDILKWDNGEYCYLNRYWLGWQARAQLTAQGPAPTTQQGKVTQVFTYKGKGGEYELVGYSNGAGPKRGESIVVYRDIRTPDMYYHRSAADFREHMEWLGGRAATQQATGQIDENAAAQAWAEENISPDQWEAAIEGFGAGVAFAATQQAEPKWWHHVDASGQDVFVNMPFGLPDETALYAAPVSAPPSLPEK